MRTTTSSRKFSPFKLKAHAQNIKLVLVVFLILQSEYLLVQEKDIGGWWLELWIFSLLQATLPRPGFLVTMGVSQWGPSSLPNLSSSHFSTGFFLIQSSFQNLPTTSAYHQHPPSEKVYTGLLIPSFPNTGSCSLFPCDIFHLFSYSQKPLGYPQLQRHLTWTSSVLQKTSGEPWV